MTWFARERSSSSVQKKPQDADDEHFPILIVYCTHERQYGIVKGGGLIEFEAPSNPIHTSELGIQTNKQTSKLSALSDTCTTTTGSNLHKTIPNQTVKQNGRF